MSGSGTRAGEKGSCEGGFVKSRGTRARERANGMTEITEVADSDNRGIRYFFCEILFAALLHRMNQFHDHLVGRSRNAALFGGADHRAADGIDLGLTSVTQIRTD